MPAPLPPVEWTLALIKPDAVRKGKSQEIQQLIELHGFTVVAKQKLQLTRARAEEFYGEHYGKPFFPKLVEFMTSGPIWAMVLGKPAAIKAWRDLMGPTNVFKAREEAPRSLRALYGSDGTQNATHGSDSSISAAREIKFYFPQLVLEPLLSNEDAKQYITDRLQPALAKALTALAREKPSAEKYEAITFIADFLLNNNPNKPRIITPDEWDPSMEEEDDEAEFAHAQLKAAADKMQSEAAAAGAAQPSHPPPAEPGPPAAQPAAATSRPASRQAAPSELVWGPALTQAPPPDLPAPTAPTGSSRPASSSAAAAQPASRPTSASAAAAPASRPASSSAAAAQPVSRPASRQGGAPPPEPEADLLNKAATQVQAAFRGYEARKDVDKMQSGEAEVPEQQEQEEEGPFDAAARSKLILGMFHRLDADRSGFIDRKEFCAALSAGGKSSDALTEEVKRHIYDMDMDGDSRVSQEEFVNYVSEIAVVLDDNLLKVFLDDMYKGFSAGSKPAAPTAEEEEGPFNPEHRAQLIRATFLRLDVDRSGFIEGREFRAALASTGKSSAALNDSVQKHISDMDFDGDQRVSEEEFANYVSEIAAVLDDNLLQAFLDDMYKGFRAPSIIAGPAAEAAAAAAAAEPESNPAFDYRLRNKLINSAFSKLDIDGSGFVDRGELTAVVARAGQHFGMVAAEVEKQFAAMDANGDNKLSHWEFSQHVTKVTMHMEDAELERFLDELYNLRAAPSGPPASSQNPEVRINAIMRAFATLDTDGSGQVDRSELIAALSKAGEHYGVVAEEVETQLAAMDKNLDSMLSPQEFATHVSTITKHLPDAELERFLEEVYNLRGAAPKAPGPDPRTQLLNSAFERLDTDRSGFVDRSELAAAIGKAGEHYGVVAEEVEAQFAAMDTNHDNRLSYSEFIHHMQQVAGHLAEPDLAQFLDALYNLQANPGAVRPAGETVATDTRTAAIHEAFGRLDADRSGFIDRGEMAVAMGRAGEAYGLVAEQVEAQFAAADVNHDNRLSLSEFSLHINNIAAQISDDNLPGFLDQLYHLHAGGNPAAAAEAEAPAGGDPAEGDPAAPEPAEGADPEAAAAAEGGDPAAPAEEGEPAAAAEGDPAAPAEGDPEAAAAAGSGSRAGSASGARPASRAGSATGSAAAAAAAGSQPGSRAASQPGSRAGSQPGSRTGSRPTSARPTSARPTSARPASGSRPAADGVAEAAEGAEGVAVAEEPVSDPAHRSRLISGAFERLDAAGAGAVPAAELARVLTEAGTQFGVITEEVEGQLGELVESSAEGGVGPEAFVHLLSSVGGGLGDAELEVFLDDVARLHAQE